MIPVEYDDEGIEKQPSNVYHPFMRGIMHFDDFNYKQFNQYVLLEEPHESEKKRVVQDRKQINA